MFVVLSFDSKLRTYPVERSEFWGHLLIFLCFLNMLLNTFINTGIHLCHYVFTLFCISFCYHLLNSWYFLFVQILLFHLLKCLDKWQIFMQHFVLTVDICKVNILEFIFCCILKYFYRKKSVFHGKPWFNHDRVCIYVISFENVLWKDASFNQVLSSCLIQI